MEYIVGERAFCFFVLGRRAVCAEVGGDILGRWPETRVALSLRWLCQLDILHLNVQHSTLGGPPNESPP